MFKKIIPIFVFLFIALPCYASTYYIATDGNNGANGSLATPWKTFAYAFGQISAGDTLILKDGTYSETAGTGVMNYDDGSHPLSAEIPSGVSVVNPTIVKALNAGSAIVNGETRAGLFIGRSDTKYSYIKVQDIKFIGGSSGSGGAGSLYNTSYCTIKNCGFHSVGLGGGSTFTIGTADHAQGNTYNLIEDCWIWGQERVIAINYRSDNNVWRRVIIRGDGCNSGACTGSGNPNVGISIYDSQYVSFQNIIVVDRILGGGYGYSDFATAQHTDGSHQLVGLEWLGCISLKSPDNGFNFEADNILDYTLTLKNIVSWDSAEVNLNIACGTNNDLSNITTGISATSSDNLRVAPGIDTGTLKNVIAYNSARYGVNSAITPTYCDVYGSATSAYNQTTCTTGALTSNPLAGSPAALKYIARIESGSALSGTGDSGDYGANVIYKYGVDGARYGDTNYNYLSANLLWPYPNQARIKSDMSADSTRGFCATNETLTNYIWNYLGNGNPYTGGGGDTTTTIKTINNATLKNVSL